MRLPNGESEVLRCLDYEGTEHVCTFPETRNMPVGSGTSGIYTAVEPQKWVKPEGQ